MSVDDEDGGDRVDDSDNPEHDERCSCNPPEPLAIRTQRGLDDIGGVRALFEFLGNHRAQPT